MKHGDREEPFVFKDNISKKNIIMVAEWRYDAGYDDFYQVMITLDEDPTPKVIFEMKLRGETAA